MNTIILLPSPRDSREFKIDDIVLYKDTDGFYKLTDIVDDTKFIGVNVKDTTDSLHINISQMIHSKYHLVNGSINKGEIAYDDYNKVYVGMKIGINYDKQYVPTKLELNDIVEVFKFKLLALRPQPVTGIIIEIGRTITISTSDDKIIKTRRHCIRKLFGSNYKTIIHIKEPYIIKHS